MTDTIHSKHYDWDDNVMKMFTKIVYFHKSIMEGTLSQVAVSTDNFAKTDKKVGKESYQMYIRPEGSTNVECSKEHPEATLVDLIDYEIVSSPSAAYPNRFSYCQFRSVEGENYFLNDLKEAVALNSFAPAFSLFQADCSCPEKIKHLSVITARGNSAKDIYEGLIWMQAQGLIKYVPLQENIYPTSCPLMPSDFSSNASNAEVAKLNVLKHKLERIEAMYSHYENIHFEFSDDRETTIIYIASALKELIAKGNWAKINISMLFTGKKDKEQLDRAHFWKNTEVSEIEGHEKKISVLSLNQKNQPSFSKVV